MSFIQILILAVIQGMAELLPVSSSAHVIVAEKWMGLDPSTPEMTFFLVMLHTGTMFAVLIYFWPRWKRLNFNFFKSVFLATAFTGIVGLSLKKIIEKVILEGMLGHAHGEVEHLFKSMPMIAAALFSVGLFILYTGTRKTKNLKNQISSGNRGNALESAQIDSGSKEVRFRSSILIGIVQGLCLPFRGFSRSGATISTALLSGISRQTAEDFSFALAVVLTPPVILLELFRLLKGTAGGMNPTHLADLFPLFAPGLIGMVFSFAAGLLALRWLSRWLERGLWKYFGIYCIVASGGVVFLQAYWF